jgi:hypothetical protein
MLLVKQHIEKSCFLKTLQINSFDPISKICQKNKISNLFSTKQIIIKTFRTKQFNNQNQLKMKSHIQISEKLIISTY